ncbi:hypothetical protein ACQP00_20425 [Dactylosporangium sp. CS-047395]|uniref:hypothetical protein n=1 Tax=Dactylosporangium sp. CS-047395 TaxID=3239936 RepID=UPI003D930D96
MSGHSPVPLPDTRLGRRTVLGLGAAIGTAALLAACDTPAAEPAPGGPASPAPIGPADAATLQSGVSGRVLLPADAGFAEEVAAYNLTATLKPAVVVAARTAADV